MNIIISNQSDLPIYEQIAESFKGEISGGELLPSIRSLAKDLRISVITTKRAYEELEKEGFIETIPGKGCFVKTKSSELLREEVLRKIEEHLINAVHMAISYGIGQEELDEILSYLYEEGGRHE